MKAFLEKVRLSITRFMAGRYGPDQLSLFLLWCCIALQLLTVFTRLSILPLLSLALMIYILFRMFSKKIAQRQAENSKYMAWSGRMKTGFAQRKLRFQRRKEYKYFHCPQCHALMRMKRGEGEKEIHCPKCQHTFKMKA